MTRTLTYQKSCCRWKTEEDSLRRFWTNYCQDAERCQNTAWLILWETVGCGEAWSPTPSATHLMCVKRDQKMSSEMLPSHTWNNWATIKKTLHFYRNYFWGKNPVRRTRGRQACKWEYTVTSYVSSSLSEYTTMVRERERSQHSLWRWQPIDWPSDDINFISSWVWLRF